MISMLEHLSVDLIIMAGSLPTEAYTGESRENVFPVGQTMVMFWDMGRIHRHHIMTR